MTFTRTASIRPETGSGRWSLGVLTIARDRVRVARGREVLLSFRPASIRGITLTKKPWLLGVRMPMLRVDVSRGGQAETGGARAVLLAVASPAVVRNLLLREAAADSLALALGARVAPEQARPGPARQTAIAEAGSAPPRDGGRYRS